MAQDPDPTIQYRRLRAALREARRSHGYTQQQVADAMDWSLSKVARIETGQVRLSTTDLKALLDHYGVAEPQQRSDYTRMAQRGRVTTWASYRDVLNPEFLTYLGFEGSASELWQFEPQVVPGLLQTRGYAEAVIQACRPPGIPDEDVARQLEVRMVRQDLLERDDRPRMRFVLDEAAIRREVGLEPGDTNIMREQIGWLSEVAGRPGISIQVVPFTRGAYPGLRGSFVLLDFPDPADPAMLFIENTHGSLATREDTAEIDLYRSRFGHLEQLALSPTATMGLLDSILASLKST